MRAIVKQARFLIVDRCAKQFLGPGRWRNLCRKWRSGRSRVRFPQIIAMNVGRLDFGRNEIRLGQRDHRPSERGRRRLSDLGRNPGHRCLGVPLAGLDLIAQGEQAGDTDHVGLG